jgi:hypothetical protein
MKKAIGILMLTMGLAGAGAAHASINATATRPPLMKTSSALPVLNKHFCDELLIESSELLFQIISTSPGDPVCTHIEGKYYGLQRLYHQLCRKSGDTLSTLALCSDKDS